MKIDVWVSRSCSHQEQSRKLVDEAVAEAGVSDVDVAVHQVDGPDDARAQKVIGSPTIRVNGVDVEYAEREPDETSPGCRYYSTPDGWKPLPERGMIVRAITVAKAREARASS